jgi:NhaP-type Na+/H+ and K+/H+ antiporter
VLAELVLYPVGSLIHVIGADRLEAVPFGILMLVGLIWYLLACANIWRAALDSGLSLGIVVSVAYLVLSMALEQQLLPDT